MIPFNYHHLYYFYVVARAGSITKACKTLLLAHPTVSLQLKEFEKAIGRPLFLRQKQRLLLTNEGRLVLDYAESIFEMGQEMQDALRDRPKRRIIETQIGITPQVPGPIAYALLRHLFRHAPEGLRVEPRIIAAREPFARLLGELRTHTVDLVLSNQDVPLEQAGEFIVREAGQIDVSFMASPALARLVKRFPADLGAVPVLLPARNNPIRSTIDHYLNRAEVKLHVIGEVPGAGTLRNLAIDGIAAAPLSEADAAADLASGKLMRLNHRPLGIKDSIWMIARRRRHHNPLAQAALASFRIKNDGTIHDPARNKKKK